MKKSRIIIPALAMIAFSVAASVTGAVAWFTAQRTATINAGTYAVVKTTSDLEVSITGGVGTSVSGGAVVVGGKLTDGSFDHVNKNIYTPNESGTGIASGDKGEIALDDENLATLLERGTTGTSNTKIYTAVTFNLTFTITFGAGNNDVALLMDNTAGKTNFSTSGTEKTAKGFRMAFVANETNGATRVLADLQAASNCHYVDGTVASGWASGNNYGGAGAYSGDLIDSAYNTALPETAQTLVTYQGRTDYLGYFKNSLKDENNQVSLSYTVVCWFEGTDPEIINRDAADFQEVAATLYFEAKDVA